MVQRFTLPHVPVPIYISFYTSVTNTPFLRSQLLAGNKSFEYAFIDATLILSTKHLLAAVFRACNDWSSNRLKSHNIHSEIVFSLGANNNIGEAFRRFGVGDQTTKMVVVKVGSKSGEDEVNLEDVRTFLGENVEGEEVEFTDADIRKVSDIDRIRKIYKISSGSSVSRKVHGSSSEGPQNGGEGLDQDIKYLETQILGAIALRGAT
jgi:EKC/KEOPS complex subunit CGI121/TPRKB